MHIRTLAVAVASVVAPAFELPACAQGKPPRPAEFAGDIGLVDTTGNTDKLEAEYHPNPQHGPDRHPGDVLASAPPGPGVPQGPLRDPRGNLGVPPA